MRRVVLEVLMLLALVAIVVVGALSYGVGETKAGVNLCRSAGDFVTIGAALRMYKVNMGRYPTTEEGLLALVEKPAGLSEDEPWVKLMDRVPVDPWQAEYRYTDRTGRSVARPFEIHSAGPDGVFNTEDDISSLRSD